MTIISDATSLILLAKAGLLEFFAERNKVDIPELVYQEVQRGKDKGREDSLLVERLVEEKKLRIVAADKIAKNKIEQTFNLKGGELEVISLAFRKNNTILTDDKKCINAAKALKIDFIISLDVIIALYRKKAISKERALSAVDSLEEYGWYSKELVKSYRGELK